ncbi:hypothetical protein BDD14_4197 [Edaphobacter modestus]|uniref:Uncharacterized protein n=1 Tax=Edaphobacter modestus TaxID=388466 RepID=A0A4V2G4X3_9BACT|nr:hypothetical protein BDD14_4197 [Edaphobacter modestus]
MPQSSSKAPFAPEMKSAFSIEAGNNLAGHDIRIRNRPQTAS